MHAPNEILRVLLSHSKQCQSQICRRISAIGVSFSAYFTFLIYEHTRLFVFTQANSVQKPNDDPLNNYYVERAIFFTLLNIFFFVYLYILVCSPQPILYRNFKYIYLNITDDFSCVKITENDHCVAHCAASISRLSMLDRIKHRHATIDPTFTG